MKEISFLLLLAACSTYKSSGDPIQDTLAKRQRQLTQCYLESDSYKGKEPHQPGMITVGFTIDPDGNVRAERILGTDFKDANLHACVLGVIDTTTFERPKDRQAIHVTQPIRFL